MAQKKEGFNRFRQDNAGRFYWSSGVSRQRHCLKMGFFNRFCSVIGLTVGSAAIAATKDHLAIVSPQGIAHRIGPVTGRRTVHSSSDFSADTGDLLTAVAEGVVLAGGRQKGYGMLVRRDHHDQDVTRHAHNARLGGYVSDHVHSGQPVACAGFEWAFNLSSPSF